VAVAVSTVRPAAAQDLGNPLGFLRELREIPLPGPNLLPGLQAPGAPAAPPDNGEANKPPDQPADPPADGALRPGSDPASQAGTPAQEPAEKRRRTRSTGRRQRSGLRRTGAGLS
jgi:hypothetical protein